MDGYNQQNQGSDQEDLDSSIESVKLNTPIIDAYIIDINKIGTWRHKLDLGRRFDHLASLKMAIRRTHPCFWVNTSSHTQMDRGLIEMNCSSAILGFVWQWGMPLLYCQFIVMKKMMIHNYFLGVPNIFRQSKFFRAGIPPWVLRATLPGGRLPVFSGHSAVRTAVKERKCRSEGRPYISLRATHV